jgi:hypothetical protein
LIVTDGITQAGLGRELADGWTAEGTSEYVNDCLSDGASLKSIPGCVLSRARELWTGAQNPETAQRHERRRRLKRDMAAPFDAVQTRFSRRGSGLGDDCTAVLASCRLGRTVNILTGPPGDRKKDREIVQWFMMMNGTKVVCGGTTAQIVAKALEKPLVMEQNPQSMLAPPRHMIEGIDLVTEGAITLNQVYNILGEAPDVFNEESGVTQLHKLLHDADRVNILIGGAINPAAAGISFRQKGILTRHKIIPLIAGKLEDSGKLVVIKHLDRQ